MNLVPVVEGHGDVTAFPELLRRLCAERNRYDISVQQGFKVSRGNLVKPDDLRERLKVVTIQRQADRILVLFDADDDCPKELHDLLMPVCSEAAVPVELIIANREYEAWFLASMDSLRSIAGVFQDAQAHPAPETPRDAKGALSRQMSTRYSETLHQAAFSVKFDLAPARNACRSFRKLESALEKLLK